MPGNYDATGLAYVAGLFDGEGCITMERRRHTSFAIYVSIANSYKPVMDELHGLFGGCLKPNAVVVNLQVWQLRMTTNGALAFLKAVRPFLRIKAAQADIAIGYLEQRKSSKARVTETEVERRHGVMRQLKEAKRISL